MKNSQEKYEIDFVVLWVDGSDPQWLSELYEYTSHSEGDKRKLRFRDWTNLKYLFRGFEKYAPWVRRIHFITCGHFPSWLNQKCGKLNLVFHDDFLLRENLPVFSSHPIELNLHRIPNLSEKFVYFNDDTFLVNSVRSDYFFKKDLPTDILIFNAIFLDSISHIRLNDIEIVDKCFAKREVLKRNFFKIFNLRYGLHQLRSLLLLPWPQMTGFYDPHQPQPFLKTTFEKVWSCNKDILERTSASRFRSREDVNQYLFRYWQLLEGNFYPRSFSDTKTIPVRGGKDVEAVAKAIRSKKLSMLCINDELENVESDVFESYKQTINQAFETLLPEKSSFEL